MLNVMSTRSILSPSQITAFEETGINSLDGFFDWLKGNGNEESLLVFKAFIDNPYWGVPLAGPSNPSGCQLTVYKPNNYQFAKQGSVSSSTRLLKLNVDTISTNAASMQNYNNTGDKLVTANQLYAGVPNNYSNLMKNKVPECNAPWPLNISRASVAQNKKSCNYQRDLPVYQLPKSKPNTYRFYI